MTNSHLLAVERLARKRKAARVRQQRCRARKRAALLQQRRSQSEGTKLHQTPVSPDSVRAAHSISHKGSPVFYPSHPPSIPQAKGWGTLVTNSGPIYKCVSFESQRSNEDSHATPPQVSPENALHSAPSVASSPRLKKPVEVVSIPTEKKGANLVDKEEAAIAAMLSLKTGPKSPPSSPKRDLTIKTTDHAPRIPIPSPKYRYYPQSWGPRHHFDAYGRPLRSPEYYKIPVHGVPSPTHYRYPYAQYPPTYARYE